MNLLKNSILFFLLASLSGHGQKVKTPSNHSSESVQAAVRSNITKSSNYDTAFVKIEMNKALYDHDKSNYPYYIISKRTAYNKTAVPKLIIRKTDLVTDNHAAVIKKYFGKYLSSQFEMVDLASLSMGENLNQYKIYPFRINTLGQIEELIDYELSWNVTSNNNLQRIKNTSSFKNTSVLATGTWYKIAITKSGIHKIDWAFFNSIGIDPAIIDPRRIRIFGNGGAALPESNSAFRYDDLEENAIQVVGETDGVFNAGDYALFYAKDKNQWKRSIGNNIKFTVDQNIYSDTSFYYINFDLANGKRAQIRASASNANISTDSYDYYNYYENNQTNFVKSGRQFFGEYFDITNSYNFNFNEGSFVVGDSILAEVTMAGRGSANTMFNVTGNGLNFNVLTYAVDVSNYLASYADVQSVFQKAINTAASSINLSIVKQTPSSIGWLDRIIINARRNLVLDQQFQFRDLKVTGTGKVCKFNIYNPQNQNATIWNVSDFVNPTIQLYNSSGSAIDFSASTDTLMEFVISSDKDYYVPKFVAKVENQNLHSIQQADYVIVTHPFFTSQSQRLATLHQQKEGLSYAIVTTDQVYNEFGSGKPDAAAIRDFIRMLYSRNIANSKQPRYVLLFGDGSYDNKNRNLSTNSSLVPTYQTLYSLSALNSIATDDFFALMDPNEGKNPESVGSLDIGVGRLTCRDVAEANAVVDKIERYYKKDENFSIADKPIENCNTASESNYGDWKNWIIFLGDDEDQSTHMADANKVALQVKSLWPVFNIDKIYLDAYQQFSTPGGQRYPDAYIDLQKRLKKGALIFNYTGHGGEVGLTAERLLDIETINTWENINRLSLFVTATCEFTRYDDPGRTSAGELCLLNPKGGAIGLFTTCRLAFSHSNLTLNSTLFDFMFKKLPSGKKPCLGDIIRRTKDTLNQSFNYSNFHLVGDPALVLSYPEKKVITSTINSKTVSPTGSDTLSALAKVVISGAVTDTLGNKLTDFNGLIYPTVFDKEQTVKCLLNDDGSYYLLPGQPYSFNLQKNILYKGKAEVKNGNFSFSFMVPKDISFAFGPGRISYYATNGDIDAAGYYEKVIVGGGSNNPIIDDIGPQVSLYLNDKNFVSGGTTNEKPILYANLIDSSGINIIGSSIGHDITAVLNGNASKPIVLNDYYEADLNTYQSGKIRYPFEELPEGNHTMAFKVWDIQNNSNTVNLDFVVAPSAELALSHVLNYPNPFTTTTKFYLEHNQACNPLKVTVQVYTISGKLVKTIQRSITCEGFRPEGIDWDGRDDFGDKLARGVYIYKVAVLNSDNKKAEKTEKLVILN